MWSGFNLSKFNIFSSKKLPLLIELVNSDEDSFPIRTIFKNGDDLKQDMLTIQAIRLMDEIWKENDLDLCLLPYSVVGTGFQQGYLEYVSDSITIAEIQYKKSVWNTFSENSIKNFMVKLFKEKFKGVLNVRSKIEEYRQTFTRSTAGYWIISYILGLKDRHPDNIMINKTNGNLFHIDFGHFLGNEKLKFGIKRERDPFVLTKEMAKFIKTDINKLVNAVEGDLEFEKLSRIESTSLAVPPELWLTKAHSDTNEMTNNYVSSVERYGSYLDQGSFNDNFYEFIKLWWYAFNVIRKDHKRLLNLFSLMTGANMPELYEDEHVEYIKQALVLDLTEEQASILFQKEIKKST